MSESAAYDEFAANVESLMAIVTVRAGERMDGCLVGFSTQCSMDPVRHLVCLSTANKTCEIARYASTLVVHMLHRSDGDRALARLFGEETAYETDKLDRCDWAAGPDGVPVLAGCDWFAGRIVDQVGLGDHLGFVIDVGEGEAGRASEPHLSFREVRDLDAGRDAGEGESV